ncbi:MAG: serine/threonine-protein kinase [Minicystis sp.]
MDAPAPPVQTLAYGDTLLGTDPHAAPPPNLAMQPTALAVTQLAAGGDAAAMPRPQGGVRSTILPRIEDEAGALSFRMESKNRYEPVKLLGQGGMGEVVLVEDQDIARRVAVKRLLPELSHPSILARFIDEIRTVGRLEHPNIVPIHDVGVDDLGRYFFVMKYVEGETLETIIEKLVAGDPDYHARYTHERRIEIFLGLLHALEYAHEKGVVHRDIKPANVMIGRFGEVVLMDWGIAKPLDATRDVATSVEAEVTDTGSPRSRAFTTRVGSIIGTPAYMAPEQARGENDRIDARSDLYSACVLFHELVCLRHYLADAPSMEVMLDRVRHEDANMWKLYETRDPDHGPPPAELIHFVHEGMALDPARRHSSAAAMIARLQSILEGKIPVQCPFTFTKRMSRETSRFVDRAPMVAFVVLLSLFAGVIFAVVVLVRSAVTGHA